MGSRFKPKQPSALVQTAQAWQRFVRELEQHHLQGQLARVALHGDPEEVHALIADTEAVLAAFTRVRDTLRAVQSMDQQGVRQATVGAVTVIDDRPDEEGESWPLS